jgi:hypothetical protein
MRWIIFGIILSLSYSCTDTKNQKNTTTNTTDGTSTGVTGFTTLGSSGGTGSTTGEPIVSEPRCTGGTEDGYADIDIFDGPPLSPLIIYPITLAGKFNWKPGESPKFGEEYINEIGETESYRDPVPDLAQIHAALKTDGDLFVRIRTEAQYKPNPGDEYCYQRITNSFADKFDYTVLKYRLTALTVKKTGPSSYEYGTTSRTIDLTDPIGVGECSKIYRVPAIQTGDPDEVTIVVVEDVRSDNYCQVNGLYCPAEYTVRQQSCWRATLQISTSNTHFFQGYKRTDF